MRRGPFLAALLAVAAALVLGSAQLRTSAQTSAMPNRCILDGSAREREFNSSGPDFADISLVTNRDFRQAVVLRGTVINNGVGHTAPRRRKWNRSGRVDGKS